jgi:alginate O-acetyltransferase complex protein AlgI
MTMLGHMFSPDFTGLSSLVDNAMGNQRLVILLMALAVFLLPAHPVTGPFLETARTRWAGGFRAAVLTAGLGYSTILIANGTFIPFLYYQF